MITRPEQDAHRMADTLEQKGFHVLCESFLNIHYDVPDNSDLYRQDIGTYAGLIFTSANGVRGFERLDLNHHDIPVFTVGAQTAECAKEAGFQNVVSASGALDDLVALLNNQDPEKPYLYIRGRDITKNLDILLPHHTIDELIVYHADQVNQISPLTEKVMMRGELDAVLFYSVRTAEAFRDWLMAQLYADNIAAGLKRTRALCLGPSMVQYLSDMPWKDVQVARAPNTTSLMALLIDNA